MTSVIPVITDDKQLPQLRISARVQNKQRRDDCNKGDISSTCENTKKIDANSQDEDEEDDRENNLLSNEDEKKVKQDVKKRRRTWELWSVEDKKTFFEAINECGKDFEAIQNYIVGKLRKKGSQSGLTKNKDQVRHFYYRTWHKISKHVKFSNDVKKSTQELYALINYGELRRKVGGGALDEKKGQKLQELIQKGSTSVRVKGKSIRVRTPICRALKKLNEFQDDRDQSGTRVPVDIQVEIHPRSVEAWNLVQSLSHNPRVQILCSLHKPVAKIIEYLQHKWKAPRVKIKESLVTNASFPVEVPTNTELNLRLTPVADSIINRVHVKPDSQVKSTAVSLLSHEEMLLKRGDTATANKKVRSRKASTSAKSDLISADDKIASEETEENNEGTGGELSQEETEGSDVEFEDEAEHSSSAITLSNRAISAFVDDMKIKEEPNIYQSNSEEEEEEIQVLTTYQMNIKEEETESIEILHQLMALETVAGSGNPHDDDVICLGENTRLSAQIRDQFLKSSGSVGEEPMHEDSETAFSMELDDEDKNEEHAFLDEENFGDYEKRIRRGWTSKSSLTVTVGQLYLMFGANQKIVLDYDFEDAEEMDVAKIEADPSVLGDNSVINSTSPDGPKTNKEVANEISRPDNDSNLQFKVLVSDNASSPPNISMNSEAVSYANSESGCLYLPDLVNQGPSLKVPSVPLNEFKCKQYANLSKMMNQLFFIMKSLSSPEGCFCKNPSAKTAPSSLRSPIGIRCGGNLGRSPGGSTRSPRGLASSTRSPRTPTSSFSKSPGTGLAVTSSAIEKAKPSSAKRLLPEICEKLPFGIDDANQMESRAAEGDGSNEAMESVTSSGEFRIPVGPAPRVQNTSSEFNAQLTKLLPRYSMPRRTMRKNVVVQRQLPLLPRMPHPHPGFVTFKVLPHQNNLEGLSFASSDIRKPTPLAIKLPLSSPLNTAAETKNNSAQPVIVQHVTAPPTLLPKQMSNSLTTNPITMSNAISVNVSGHQLLTVEMPSISPRRNEFEAISTLPSTLLASPLIITSAPSPGITEGPCFIESKESLDAKHSKPLETLTLNENSDSLSMFFTENGSGMPYISVSSCSQKRLELNLPKDFKGVFTSGTSSAIEQLKILPTTPIRNSTSLSVPSESSLLNTPVHLLNSASICQKDLSVAKLNISTLFAADEPLSQSEEEIPEIHIPECGDNLPLLDISIGGTVSVCDAAKKATKQILPLNSSLAFPLRTALSSTELNLSVTCVTTSMAASQPTTSVADEDPSLQAAFRDSSCDKIMDITLANSNSNSSFSSLLAAANCTPILDTMENSILKTPPRNSLSKNGLEPFESLSAVPPSPPSSPSRLLRQTDVHWLQHDSNEFSLSSFLGSMESPIKGGASALSSGSLGTEGSPPQSLISAALNDNTVDFTATFAKLKKQTKENHD